MAKMVIYYTKKETKKGVYAKIMVIDQLETLDLDYKTELVKKELFKSLIEKEVNNIKQTYWKTNIKQVNMTNDDFDKLYKSHIKVKRYVEGLFDDSWIEEAYAKQEKENKH